MRPLLRARGWQQVNNTKCIIKIAQSILPAPIIHDHHPNTKSERKLPRQLIPQLTKHGLEINMTIAVDSQRSGPPGQPDIAYTPNYETYEARTQRRLETETLPKRVPDGFPDKVASDLVWDGKTVSTHYEWSYELNDQERAEIDEALRSFKCPPYPPHHPMAIA